MKEQVISVQQLFKTLAKIIAKPSERLCSLIHPWILSVEVLFASLFLSRTCILLWFFSIFLLNEFWALLFSRRNDDSTVTVDLHCRTFSIWTTHAATAYQLPSSCSRHVDNNTHILVTVGPQVAVMEREGGRSTIVWSPTMQVWFATSTDNSTCQIVL
jgi:hypothetical protein